MLNDIESGYVASVMANAIGQIQSDILYTIARPSIQFRPKISLDGNKWCALYGEDLQCGVSGFGDSPDLAMLDFDKSWMAKLQAKEPSHD